MRAPPPCSFAGLNATNVPRKSDHEGKPLPLGDGSGNLPGPPTAVCGAVAGSHVVTPTLPPSSACKRKISVHKRTAFHAAPTANQKKTVRSAYRRPGSFCQRFSPQGIGDKHRTRSEYTLLSDKHSSLPTSSRCLNLLWHRARASWILEATSLDCFSIFPNFQLSRHTQDEPRHLQQTRCPSPSRTLVYNDCMSKEQLVETYCLSPTASLRRDGIVPVSA